MNATDKPKVGNQETLYRRVVNKEEMYKNGNKKILSSQAFTDPTRQPSVDRAFINKNDPTCTQIDLTDGVISLITGDVCSIENLNKHDINQRVIKSYNVFVVQDPIENSLNQKENKAHALIVTTPVFTLSDNSVFKRLKERLACLANEKGIWVIPLQE